jgi:hypothetical protein
MAAHFTCAWGRRCSASADAGSRWPDAIYGVLIDKSREERYPSRSQACSHVLLDKIAKERFPSIDTGQAAPGLAVGHSVSSRHVPPIAA